LLHQHVVNYSMSVPEAPHLLYLTDIALRQLYLSDLALDVSHPFDLALPSYISPMKQLMGYIYSRQLLICYASPMYHLMCGICLI